MRICRRTLSGREHAQLTRVYPRGRAGGTRKALRCLSACQRLECWGRLIPASGRRHARDRSAGKDAGLSPRTEEGRGGVAVRFRGGATVFDGLSPRAWMGKVHADVEGGCRYTRILTDCQPSCVIGCCQILCVMASQSRLRRRQAMTGFGSWRTRAEDAVSIRVYSGGCCQVSCVMVIGKSLLRLVSCQHSCVIVLSIRVYPQRERHQVYPRAWADWAWRSLIDRSKGSVHAQGNFRSASSVQLRFIPACVGESPRSSSTDLSPRAGGRSRVCPCACGGKLENCYQHSIARGSSLRVNRGTGDVQDAIVRDGLSPCAQGRDASCTRSILACVGVGRWIAGRCQAVYPRVCGREGAAAVDCVQSG